MAAASGGLSRFYLLLGAALVAGLAAIGFVAFRKPAASIPANPVITPADTSGFRGYVLGSDSAPLEVTEYADYECPACQQFAVVQFPTIAERLIRTGKVRWRYRDLPLDIHPNALTAAHAAACADEQGKFWEMNERIYSWEPRWPEQGSRAATTFRKYAQAIGLDIARYDECMNTARYAPRLLASKQEAQRLGVPSTPTFLINGRLYPGSGKVHYDMLKALLDSLSGAGTR
jgi:protein-disulfide isomerase